MAIFSPNELGAPNDDERTSRLDTLAFLDDMMEKTVPAEAERCQIGFAQLLQRHHEDVLKRRNKPLLDSVGRSEKKDFYFVGMGEFSVRIHCLDDYTAYLSHAQFQAYPKKKAQIVEGIRGAPASLVQHEVR